MSKFMILLNDGIYYDYDYSNVFNDDRIKKIFEEELGGSNFEFDEEDEDEMELEEGIEYLKEMGGIGEKVKCLNCFVGMGDDYCELSIVELKE